LYSTTLVALVDDCDDFRWDKRQRGPTMNLFPY
jgi:hypothetical protein